MINNIREALTAAKVEEEKVHFELFTVPGAEVGERIQHEVAIEDLGKVCDVTVTVDGKTFESPRIK